MKKTIILFITFISIGNLSAAESSKKQQVLEWIIEKLPARFMRLTLKPRIAPPAPKPRMVPALRSLSDIAFDKLEELKPKIIDFVEKNNVDKVHFFLLQAQKRLSQDFLIELLTKSQSEEMAAAIIHAPGFDVNATTKPIHAYSHWKKTPLHWACDKDCSKYWACNKNKSKIVQLLLAAGAGVNTKDTHGLTPLHTTNETEIVTMLIAAKADVNAENTFKMRPLHFNHNIETMKILIAAGANVDAQNDVGDTPLHRHCYNEAAEILIKAGANVNIKNEYGKTPLHIQQESRSPKVIELLINAGAEVNEPDNNGSTPLHFCEDFECGKLLIAAGANVKATNNKLRTPLHNCKKVALAELLIENGADVNARDKYKQTPLHWTINAYKTDVIRLLIEKGADLDAQDIEGNTPLHMHAIPLNNVQLVIEAGTNPCIKNAYGQLPYQIRYQNKEVREYLEEAYDKQKEKTCIIS